MSATWPVEYPGGIQASQLIKELATIIEEHGDLPVFSEADWSWVIAVRYEEKGGYHNEKKPFITLE